MPPRRYFVLLVLVAPLVALALGHTTGRRPSGTPPTSFDTPPRLAMDRARYLIVGGGGEPDSAEVQLEEEVLDLVRQLGPGGVTLFAGGRGRVGVRVEAQSPRRTDFRTALGEVFLPRGRASGFRVPRVRADGPASYELVTSALASALDRDGPPLLVVLATHGEGAEDRGDAFALLWGNDGLFVHEVVDLLREAPSKRPTRWLVGSCHGGAFAGTNEVAFVDGEALHCGFYATREDRLASGCDPDPDRRRHEGYLRTVSAFLARPIDVDGDGRTTLEDAHLIAMRDLEGYDVPLRSSDRFLEDAIAALGLSVEEAPIEPHAEGRVVAGTLLRRLRVEPDDVESEYARAQDRLDHADDELDQLSAMRDVAWNRLRVALLERHPWLEDAYAPGWERNVERHRAEIEPLVTRSDLAQALARAESELAASEAGRAELASTEAQLGRLVDVAFRARARGVLRRSDAARYAQYEALLRCEAYLPPRP